MRFSAITLAAVIPTLVSATNFTINVGSNNSLAYDPPQMNASVGDLITFVFQSKNHSVYASTFADPCTPATGPNAFNSSFFPISGNGAGFPTFVLNVSQTQPIWFYCAQTTPANHCKAGMVGVINPTADKTLDQFKANAMGNSSSTNTSSTGAPFPSPSPKPNSAVRTSGGAALLTLVSVMAGITAL